MADNRLSINVNDDLRKLKDGELLQFYLFLILYINLSIFTLN